MKQSKEYYRDIYERYVDDIYRLCFSYLKNVHDCEDAVSAVFCTLMQKEPSFSGDEQTKAWLVVTACNQCKTMLRNLKRHPQTDISELNLQDTAGGYERCEMLELIIQLPPKYTSVLYLHYYLDYSLSDIAKMLKANESTIRSRLHYGKKKLAKILGGNDYERIYGGNESNTPLRGAKEQNV